MKKSGNVVWLPRPHGHRHGIADALAAGGILTALAVMGQQLAIALSAA